MSAPIVPDSKTKLLKNKKCRKRVLLFRRDSNARWGGEFTDSLYLVKREDGTFRLYARKDFEGETITLDRVCGIRTSGDFVGAFARVSQFVDNDGIRRVTEKIGLLDRSFARELDAHMVGKWADEENP